MFYSLPKLLSYPPLFTFYSFFPAPKSVLIYQNFILRQKLLRWLTIWF